MHKVSEILNSNYKLLTKDDTKNNNFKGVYATDLLSSAIKHIKDDNMLVTIITSQTTLSLCQMLDIEVVVIINDENVSDHFIQKANTLDIAVIKTRLHAHEVILDLNQRGMI